MSISDIRTHLAAFAILAAVAPHAFAQDAPTTPQVAAPLADDSMNDYFANTLTIEIPGVWKAKRYFAADHTYWQTGDDGEVKGTWSIEDGKVCTVQVPAKPHRLEKYCNIGIGKHAGDAWDDHDPMSGNRITFALVPGRAETE